VPKRAIFSADEGLLHVDRQRDAELRCWLSEPRFVRNVVLGSLHAGSSPRPTWKASDVQESECQDTQDFCALSCIGGGILETARDITVQCLELSASMGRSIQFLIS
jgi:hypothetical protein